MVTASCVSDQLSLRVILRRRWAGVGDVVEIPTLKGILMLLNSRVSQEVPGSDKAANPKDPIRFIELVVIPAAAKMDPSLTIFKLTRKQQSLVLPLFAELRNA